MEDRARRGPYNSSLCGDTATCVNARGFNPQGSMVRSHRFLEAGPTELAKWLHPVAEQPNELVCRAPRDDSLLTRDCTLPTGIDELRLVADAYFPVGMPVRIKFEVSETPLATDQLDRSTDIDMYPWSATDPIPLRNPPRIGRE